MKNRKMFFLLIILFLCFISFLLFQFNKPEGTRYSTLNEAITKGIKNDINKIIHTEIVNDYVMIMYQTTKQEIGIAIFEESSNNGWRKYHHVWGYNKNQSFTVDHSSIINKKDHSFDNLVYGEINNKDISKIEISVNDEILKANIIEMEGEKYYYSFLGNKVVDDVNGFTNDGRVIEN